MGLHRIEQLIDSETQQPVDLVICPCGNKIFYFTAQGKRFCSCCSMTEQEAEQARQDVLSWENAAIEMNNANK